MSRLYKILNKLAGSAIIETGTSNGWSYRKYADGYFEASREATTNVAISTSSGGIYFSPSIGIGVPSAFNIASVLYANCNYSGAEGIWAKINSANASGFSVGLVSSVTRSAAMRTLYCTLKGRWS